ESSMSTNISMTPEIIHVEHMNNKSEPSSRIIELVNDKPEISPDLPVNNKSKASNEKAISQPEPLPPSYLTREQREVRLRKWAVDHGENPDKFMTITEKDIDLSRIYRDRMMSDAEIIQFARDTNEDPESLMYANRRERLISEEIYLHEWED